MLGVTGFRYAFKKEGGVRKTSDFRQGGNIQDRRLGEILKIKIQI